jgi:GLUG motif-containing protein
MMFRTFDWCTASRTCCALVVLSFFAQSARAAVNISSDPTQNMSCSNGVCSPTAKNATLNVNDLTDMLASGDVRVTTRARAVTIGVAAPFSWTSSHQLTLEAKYSIHFKAAVAVAGSGAVTLITNEGVSGGELSFVRDGGSLTFWDLNSRLTIDGHPYILVSDIKTLAANIANDPSGHYALANDYDAGADDVHKRSPIQPDVQGVFNGLGHAVRNLVIKSRKYHRVGFFSKISEGATVASLLLRNVTITAGDESEDVGTLTAWNDGLIRDAGADGSIAVSYSYSGGLVGVNGGTITTSSASVEVTGSVAGGLVGWNARGTISLSRATGDVTGGKEAYFAGGLVGWLFGGRISNSYAAGDVAQPSYGQESGGLVGTASGGIDSCYAIGTVGGPLVFASGGLVGGAESLSISQSYSMGAVTGKSDGSVGGFIGFHNNNYGGTLASNYWDLDTSSISDPSRGAGNIANDPGIAGLTDAQLKSGLPDGFDPAIWGENPNLNNGYPYLLANPPPN